MVACSEGSGEAVGKEGIVSGHAYTLLGVYSVPTKMGNQRLVKLRNPWGHQEWTGEWSDGHQIWDQVLNQQEKSRIGYTNNLQDGIFFMPYDNFIKKFANVELV